MTTCDFRTDGGATWLNLLATQGRSFGANPVERLPDEAAVEAWLDLMGLRPDRPVATDHRSQLLELREHLRELALAAADARDADPAAVDAVTVAAAADGGLGPALSPPTFAQVLAAIAVSALLALRGPDRAFLTSCDESDCRWVFLDPSGRRRWCPAPACASRGRVRAHRAARQAGADAARPTGRERSSRPRATS